MINEPFSKQYSITQNQLDEYDQLSIHGILDLFQDIAGRHAEKDGLGYKSSNESGVNWILARTRFEVLLPWEYLSDVTVKTWPHTPERFEVERDYRIIDDKRRLLIKGSSIWVLIDNNTHSLARTNRLYHDDDVFPTDKNFEERLSSLRIDDESLDKQYDFVVTRHQLDHNLHMNNSRYGEECDNLINLDNHHYIKYFEMDYIAPSFLGEKLLIKYSNHGNQIYGIIYCGEAIRNKFKIIIGNR